MLTLYKIMISNDFSDTIWHLKGIAIFTVFFAHFSPTYPPLLIVYNIVGVMGVPTFMMISGYFDFKSRSSLNKRIRALLIPLLIWGTLTWLFSIAINRPELNIALILSWLKWIIGCGTWLYFVTSLLICVLLSKLPKSDYWLPVISIISIVLTQYDIIPYNAIFTKYTNPLNFAIYFSLGRWIRYYLDDNTISISLKLLSVSIIIFFLSAHFVESYFCIAEIGVGITSPIILLWIANKWHWKLWHSAGVVSFVIYFAHMQIGGVINTRIPITCNTPFETLKVLIIFTVVFSIACCLNHIMRNLPQLSRCVGFR